MKLTVHAVKAYNVRRARMLHGLPNPTHRVEYVPVGNVPGFTHRVIIDGKAEGYLGDNAKPNGRSAAFFVRTRIYGMKD